MCTVRCSDCPWGGGALVSLPGGVCLRGECLPARGCPAQGSSYCQNPPVSRMTDMCKTLSCHTLWTVQNFLFVSWGVFTRDPTVVDSAKGGDRCRNKPCCLEPPPCIISSRSISVGVGMHPVPRSTTLYHPIQVYLSGCRDEPCASIHHPVSSHPGLFQWV